MNSEQLPPNPIVGGGMSSTRAVSRIGRSGVLSEDATTGCAATPGAVRRDCAWGKGFALRVHDMVGGDEDYEHQQDHEGYSANFAEDHGV